MTTPTDPAIAHAHLVDDLELDRTAHRRAMHHARDLIDTARDANRAGDHHVTAEYLDRAYDLLYAELVRTPRHVATRNSDVTVSRWPHYTVTPTA